MGWRRTAESYSNCSANGATTQGEHLARFGTPWPTEQMADPCMFSSSIDRTGHFIFDQRWIVGIWFGPSGGREFQTSVECDGGFITGRHHQLHRAGPAETCPSKNFIHQLAAYALLAVRRSCPHGDKVRSRCVLLIEG